MDSRDFKDKVYLGDGVYCGHDGYHIWLYLSNGLEELSHIALEPEVLMALDRYRKYLSASTDQEVSDDAE